jgi:prepilin-type N-terminal cleavage/methylation domain-containing protein
MNTMRRNRGFTLVELLVASVLSGAVLTSIYFVFISNSRQYYTQEQVVQMQESMRFALEYLKNDLRNAGQMALVNGTAVDTDPFYCGPRSDDLRAVDLMNNTAGADAPAILSNLGNAISPDRISILSDASGGTMLGARFDGANLKLLARTEQISASSMRIVESAPRFNALFRTGYYLRIMAPTGHFDLVPITGVAFAAGGESTVTLSRPPLCVAAAAESLRVNTVQRVRYRIIADPADATKTNLIREVIDASNPAQVVAGGTLTVAEFVVNLQVWGTYDSRLAALPKDPVINPDPRLTDDVGNWTPVVVNESLAMNVRPHRIRALNVLLATRSNREDADMHLAPDIARNENQRIAADRTWFDVVAEAAPLPPNFARVTTLQARVETPNLLTEGDL